MKDTISAKTIRNELAVFSMEFCRCVDDYMASARNDAIDALEGDQKAKESAIRCKAMADAYKDAFKKLDAFRLKLERVGSLDSEA